jgi:hypothetical protein
MRLAAFPGQAQGFEMKAGQVCPDNKKITLNLAVGGCLEAESSNMRPEIRFNLRRGTIFGYHLAQFEEASGECRFTSRF